MHNFIIWLKKNVYVVLIGIMLSLILGFFWYTSDYYHADQLALDVLERDNVIEHENYVELKADSDIGLIFYPGAKVEAYAYLVLLESLNKHGVNVYLVKMPFNLAVLNTNAANAIREDYPEINQWFIAGHSLGGAMASQYLKNNAEYFDGLIQLAAYPVNQSEENTLILYGTNDKVLNLSKLEGYDSYAIQGGNHAYFGDYGEQSGDGKALISRSVQQQITIEAIIEFIR